MLHRALALILLVGGVARADEPDDLPTPPPEHGAAAQLDLPAIPPFTFATTSDGSHTIRELRVHGAKLLATTLTVRGVITWVYDCATAVRKPGETDRTVAKHINDDPTLCERPKFYVGDDAKTPVEKSLWIVDVPRPYNKLELERIAKTERTMPDRCEPGAKVSVCPPYRVGDKVIVTGTFNTASPHSERNSDGLLVYGSMQNTTLAWQTPGTTWSDAQVVNTTPPSRAIQPPPPQPPPAAGKPMRKVVDPKVHDDSMASLMDANRAMALKHWSDAEAAYGKAVATWPGNHLAWSGLGGALGSQARWKDAAEAFGHAVELRPDVAMYRLWYGVALYERAVDGARQDQARKEDRKPEEVSVDLAVVNFEKPRQQLLTAARLDPGLWRAHYYLGRIARGQGQAKSAAESFTLAVRASASSAPPYIALGELYRQWDYTDEALAVAALGTQHATSDLGNLWYELGMAYDDKRMTAEAIDAFTKSLAASPDNAKAKFQRGQIYFRTGARAKAKHDLEEFAASTGPGLDFAKQQAHVMLLDLATKR